MLCNVYKFTKKSLHHYFIKNIESVLFSSEEAVGDAEVYLTND